jgi:hypothetical protein
MQNNFSWDLDYPYIAHYGVPHGHGPNGGSGRYPWGSGEKWRKIRAGVKNAGDKIKKFFGGKDRVDTSAVPKNWDQMTPAERAEWSNKHQDALLKGESSTQTVSNEEKRKTDPWNPDNYSLSEIFKMKDGQPDVDFAYKNDEKYKQLLDRSEELTKQINDEENNRTSGRGAKLTDEQLKSLVDELDSNYRAEKNRLQEVISAQDKKTALESGSREEILKVFQESSNEEIQRAINKAQLMDSLNKSIADAKPKQPETKSPEQMAKEERAEYIKEALGSGDYNRIMEVATDKSVSNQDLQNALNKMNTIQSAQEKNSASAKFFENADRFKNAVDKTLGYYDTAANVWNTIAINYNNTADVKAGKSQPLGLLLTVPKNNNNQKNQNNNQQQNQQQGPPKPQQNNQNQQNNQQQVQQKQNNQKQQKGEINASNAVLQEPIKKANTISQSTKQVQKEAEEKVKNKKLDDEEEYANSLFPNWDGYGVKHSSLGNEVFEFIAYYGRGHDENTPGRGSGRYPWGSGLNPRNKQKSFFKREKNKTELSKWDPWNNRDQMQDYVNKNKKAYFFYQSQLDSDDAYKRDYAHQILSKPINTWNYYVDQSRAKNPIDWFLNKYDRKYANEWLEKHEEYSNRIANMRLSDAPDENIINFMLYYGMDQKHSQTNFMTKGDLIYLND